MHSIHINRSSNLLFSISPSACINKYVIDTRMNLSTQRIYIYCRVYKTKLAVPPLKQPPTDVTPSAAPTEIQIGTQVSSSTLVDALVYTIVR